MRVILSVSVEIRPHAVVPCRQNPLRLWLSTMLSTGQRPRAEGILISERNTYAGLPRLQHLQALQVQYPGTLTLAG